MTAAGPSSGFKCTFPFKFDGINFNACTLTLSPTGIPWCSTKVDDDGTHIGGQGNWGECSSKCPIDKSCKCKFPFIWNGLTHNACTMHSSPGEPWCSLKVDDKGQHVKGYGTVCSSECPVEEGCLCKFPFTFNGLTHNACTMHSSHSGKPWCSLKVDDKGQHVKGYGPTCSKGCPVEEGCRCVFPFVWASSAHSACTLDHSPNGVPWCAINVDDHGLVTHWSNCNQECPLEEKGKDHVINVPPCCCL